MQASIAFRKNKHRRARIRLSGLAIGLLVLLTACPSKQEQQTQVQQKSQQAELEARRAEHQGINPGSPLPSASPSSAQDPQVIAVMGQLKGLLESYDYGRDGGSPTDIRALYARVKELSGTIKIKNPYSTMEWNDQNPSGQGVVDMYQEGYCIPGLVLYRVLKTNAQGYASDYEIHGCDSAGKRLPPLPKNAEAGASPPAGSASPAAAGASPSPSPTTP